MGNIWIVAKRELGAFFNSLVAYLLIIGFLAITGIFTWFYGNDIFMRKQADLLVFFNMAFFTLFFFIPALTMRQLAEERKTGTIELLLTKDVTDRQVVVGKFLACWLLVGITLLFTLPYYMSVSQLGPIDHGATIAGYMGLMLMSAAYIGIGLFTSSITNNQIVAFLLALVIGIFFHLIFGFFASQLTGFAGELFSTLSLSDHFRSIIRGVVDTKDIIYFISLTLIGLLFAELAISNR